MITLTSLPTKLQILLDAAAATTELPLVATYIDWTASGPTYTPTPVTGITTGTTAVDIVPAPSAGTTRSVKFLSVLNVDTAVRIVTVRFNDNGTTRKIIAATLSVGDMLQYTDGEGFRVLDSTGAIKALSSRSTNDRMRSLNFFSDGGATLLTTGFKSNIRIPYSGRIQKATLLSKNGVSGSIVVDVKKSTYAGFGTPSSICASAKPTITATTKSEDSTLTGWTTTITAGDVIGINIDSVTTFTWITLILDLLTD